MIARLNDGPSRLHGSAWCSLGCLTRRKVRKSLFLVSAFLVMALIGLRILALSAGPPPNLGLHEGRLAPCPDTPNCVSTYPETDASRRMAPLTLDHPSGEVIARLRKIIEDEQGARIVEQTDSYLRAEFRSRLLGFVDDVEFLVDPAEGVIHARSASRVGYADFGVNRRRLSRLIEGVRQDLSNDSKGA